MASPSPTSTHSAGGGGADGSNKPPAAAAGTGAAPSLKQWKSGAEKMTTAEAGDHVSKTAPKPKPKPAKTASKTPPSTKPWHEQSLAERYGTKPRDNVNINKQVKDVLQYLAAYQDRVVPWEEITTRAIPAWYDTREAGTLYNALVGNPLVAATSSGFQYASKHGIDSKAALLGYIRRHPLGARSIDFKDSYEAVLEDADKLHAEGLVFKLYNSEFKMDVFFPAPEPYKNVPQDLVEAYLQTELPADHSVLSEDVTKMGLRSALKSCTRRAIGFLKQEKKPKKKRKLQIQHMTNTHLAHVLNDNQYTSID